MATCSDLIDRLRTKLESDPSIAENFSATYKFELEGEGGGTWLIDLKGAPKVEQSDGEADCTVNMAASDFVALVAGEADGNQLYFQGKLRIDGDMGLALKLQNLAELAR